MGEISYDSGILTRYLLGDLPPAQQDSLEEKFFTENDLFIELLDAEDRLIGDYLDGRLSTDDRERFERRFLTLPELRSEVEIARHIRAERSAQVITEPATPSGHALAWPQKLINALRANLALAGAAAAVLVVITIAGVWFVARPKPESPTDRGFYVTDDPTRMVTISLELSPGRLRGEGEAPKIINASSARAIELRLAAGSTTYSNYRAKLQRLEEEAREVLASNGLKWEQSTVGERVVIWEVPTNKLSSGDYQVKLDGVNADDSADSIGSYYFKYEAK